MGMKLIYVRDYLLVVESKSGSQLAFIRRQCEKLSDEELEARQKEAREFISETFDE